MALAALLCGLFEFGCRSALPGRPTMPPATASPAQAPVPAPPAVRALPAAPEPVYRSPKIGMVYLRAHQDAEGRLLGPQVMYQIVDPGGWNIDAIEQGEGYIPAANLEVPPNIGSPYVVPAKEIPPVSERSPLLDPAAARQVTITGLMRREDRTEAEELAREKGGSTAVYDNQAGWLLLPPKSRM